MKRWKIGVGKIAIVIRFFFRAEGECRAFQGIKAPGLLLNGLPGREQTDQPAGLEFYGAPDVADRIQVLDLYPGAKRRLAFESYGDISVASHAAFFHISVADIQ